MAYGSHFLTISRPLQPLMTQMHSGIGSEFFIIPYEPSRKVSHEKTNKLVPLFGKRVYICELGIVRRFWSRFALFFQRSFGSLQQWLPSTYSDIFRFEDRRKSTTHHSRFAPKLGSYEYQPGIFKIA